MKRDKTFQGLVQKILSLKQKTRGADLKKMADYVRKEAGEEKLKEVEEFLEMVGHPMPYKDLQKVKVYTLGERLLYLFAIKNVLGWSNKRLKEMGYFVGKNLIIVKYFSHLFRISEKFFFTALPKIGDRYMEGLRVVPLKGNVEQKRAIFKITGLELKKEGLEEIEEMGLEYFSGFFAGWAQMILGTEKVRCKAKRSENGYAFNITWI